MLTSRSSLISASRGIFSWMSSSRSSPFEAALPLLGDERIRLDEMIADRFALQDAAKGFERAAQRGVLKVLLGVNQ